MGKLDDFSLDQVAGSAALIVSSIGGLLLIVFKSKCRTISCCWGMWSCVRDISEVDESDEEEVIPKESSNQTPQESEPVPDVEP